MGESGMGEHDAFSELDSKLTIFALANGMNLTKAESGRSLEWFSEGLERGIDVRAVTGAFQLSVSVWRTGDRDGRHTESLADGLSEEAALGALTEAVETANSLTL